MASANDATVALGEAVAGSEEGFVAMMNARAKELGMLNTNFVNATGLDAEGHVTTAHDVALMSCELIKHDLIKKYSTVWMDTLRDGKSELVSWFVSTRERRVLKQGRQAPRGTVCPPPPRGTVWS